MKPDIKKIITTNLPYLLFVWLFGKMGEAWRLAAGTDLTQKLLHFMDSLAAAFAKDIAPYIDPVFENNILLTQTERLTMNGRPKDPRTARNKNVLVIGGSGSGGRAGKEAGVPIRSHQEIPAENV